MPRWNVTTTQDLAVALAGARREAGMTQAELAQWAGLDRRYVSVLESGGASLQVQRLLDLFAVLGYQLRVLPRSSSAADEPPD